METRTMSTLKIKTQRQGKVKRLPKVPQKLVAEMGLELRCPVSLYLECVSAQCLLTHRSQGEGHPQR